eukprot:1153545-Pelagomonas_calceolata.AAC.2
MAAASCCGCQAGLLLRCGTASPVWMGLIVVNGGWPLRSVRCRVAPVDILLTYEIAELNAGAAAAGPAKPGRQARFPVLVGLHVAHVPHKLNLFGQPCVQVARPNLQEGSRRRSVDENPKYWRITGLGRGVALNAH